MASLHFCSSTASLYQGRTRFSSMLASSFNSTNIKTRLKPSSSKQCPHRLQALPQGNAYSFDDQTVKSLGPYICSSTENPEETPLSIGIIGFGGFGQFLAKSFIRRGHNVIATSRSDYSDYCKERGIKFFQDVDELCRAEPDILLVCTSILSTEEVVGKIPFHLLKSNTIISEVLSVKEYPKKLLLKAVPQRLGILCTHPMFGKFSGEHSWKGLRFVYDKVRINSKDSFQDLKCRQFLSIFEDEGCRMVEMPCEEHDLFAAKSQFITHLIARVLSQMSLESTPVDTKGYETLLELTKNTTSHSSDLFDGLYLYNSNAKTQIENLERAFEVVKKKLFKTFLHTMSRKISEESTNKIMEAVPASYKLTFTKEVKDLSSFSLVPRKVTQDASQTKR